MSSRMPLTRYKSLKERLAEINKGFWKVQSIHKLSTKLSNKFNTKDFIIMKTIQKTPNYIPPFITFSNESKKNRLKINNSERIKLKQKENKNNLFLTIQNRKKRSETRIKTTKENKKKLFLNLYKNFPYEPFLYNELQFIYLQGSNKLIPRKFNEVVKDCFIMDKYNKLLKKSRYNILNPIKNSNSDTSKFTLISNKSKNKNNNEDKDMKDINFNEFGIKKINIEKKISNSRKYINTKCKTENNDLIINKNNNINILKDRINKKERSRMGNGLPLLGYEHLTEGNNY